MGDGRGGEQGVVGGRGQRNLDSTHVHLAVDKGQPKPFFATIDRKPSALKPEQDESHFPRPRYRRDADCRLLPPPQSPKGCVVRSTVVANKRHFVRASSLVQAPALLPAQLRSQPFRCSPARCTKSYRPILRLLFATLCARTFFAWS